MAEVMANESFEGGASGTAITTSNSGFDNAPGGSPTFDSARFHTGSQSFLCNPTSATEVLSRTTPGTDVGSIRFYYNIDDLPAAAVFINTVLQSPSTTRAQLRLNADGTVTMRNNVTAVATTTFALSPDTWYRFEWQLSGTSGSSTQALRIFLGDNTSPISGADVSGTFNTGTFNRWNIGATAAATIVSWWDDVRITDVAEFQGPTPIVSTWSYGYDVRIG